MKTPQVVAKEGGDLVNPSAMTPWYKAPPKAWTSSALLVPSAK